MNAPATSSVAAAIENRFYSAADYQAVMTSRLPLDRKLAAVGDMLRADMLSVVFTSGTGHLGASMSAADLLAALYFHEMRIDPSKPNSNERDIFVLSKGHAAPAQYAVLGARGYFPATRLATFRRLGGLQGHVDRLAPGVDGNTGSLGMGLSKAKGWAWAHKSGKTGGRAFAMVGDGELQEGQNWEALQSAASLGLDNLTLIIDRNHVQTDLLVKDIVDPLVIEDKLRAFGWETVSINGHSTVEILGAFEKLNAVRGKPKAIVADTVKGKGVSFMEHPAAMKKERYYHWHGRVPNRAEYTQAIGEIRARLEPTFSEAGLPIVSGHVPDVPAVPPASSTAKVTSLVDAFAKFLPILAEQVPEVVVFDGDLEESCGLRAFHEKFPARFIEVGAAEQDMVSMAGAIAHSGRIPILNTYSAFLSSRSNEQIFNNATEHARIVYVGHMCGLIPSTPGKSHQAVRDIAVLRGIPELLVCEPSNAWQLESIMRHAVQTHRGQTYVRLANAPGACEIPAGKDKRLKFGEGVVLREGDHAALVGYGPIFLAQALGAVEQLVAQGIRVKLIDLPWINAADPKWLSAALKGFATVFALDNHSARGGLGDELAVMMSRGDIPAARLVTIGVEGFAQSGKVDEVLEAYGLSASGIAARIQKTLK